jgi:VanZ family protein
MITSTFNGIRVASICLIGYWLVLFVGTHLPRVRMPNVAGGHSDKILHLVAFAGLSFLLAWAIPTKLSDRFRNVRIAALAAVLYGAIDEVTQIPVGRTADWLDLIADTIGVGLGIIAYSICREIYWRLKSRFASPEATDLAR